MEEAAITEKGNDICNLIKYIQNVKTMPRNMAPSRGLYPSGQFIKIGDIPYGQCPRKVYYQNTRPEKKVEIDRMNRMAFMGNRIEDGLISYAKRIGVHVKDQYQLVDVDEFWSGKVDLLTYGFDFSGFLKREDVKIDYTVLIPIEIKTVWGYQGKLKVINSNRNNAFEPKENAVMQVSLYIDYLQRKGYPVPFGKIWYIGRDEGDSATHTIKIIKNEDTEGNITRRIYANDKWYKGFTIEGILAWNKKTKDAIDNKELPPREFRLQYSEAVLKDMLAAGTLNKEQTGLVSKDRFVPKGDIQCQYCDFSDECYSALGEGTEIIEKLYADNERVL